MRLHWIKIKNMIWWRRMVVNNQEYSYQSMTSSYAIISSKHVTQNAALWNITARYDGHSWQSRWVAAAVVAHQGETTQLAVIFFGATESYLSSAQKPSPSKTRRVFYLFRLFHKSCHSARPKNVKPGKTTDQTTTTRNICATVRIAKPYQSPCDGHRDLT